MSSRSNAKRRTQDILAQHRLRAQDAAANLLRSGAMITWGTEACGGESTWGMGCAPCGIPRTPYPPKDGMTHKQVLARLQDAQERHNKEHHPK